MRPRLLASALTLFALLAAGRARAEEPAASPTSSTSSASSEQCAAAYEQAQEQRKSGRLVEARATLRLCARDECPGFIHDDCLTWHGEVASELPTLVFSATSGGRDLVDVRVATSDRVLATRLEGQVIELDPGEYELTFSATGSEPRPLQLVVARGEKNRLVRVELTELTPPGPDVALAPPRADRSLTVPALFAGVGLAGLGGFVALGAWGRSSESRLADTCSPGCNADDVGSVRTKYVLADVSLGVGVAGLALAAYTFFSQSPRSSGRAGGVSLHATSSDLRMTYGGHF
jgi:hypothetical protein